MSQFDPHVEGAYPKDHVSEDYTFNNQHRHSASVKDQLATWHANRGDRSFVRCMIPSIRGTPPGELPTTKNPIKLFRMVSPFAWLMFFSGWLAWTVDGYDFFCVSLTLDSLADQFKVKPAKITTAITLTLLFRSLGAVIFGILSDRYGRKWPLVCCLLLIMCFELGSGFVNTYTQFLAVRSLFGVTMGDKSDSANSALENVPADARGLLSGIMQQGYAVGYLLAAVINLTIVQYSKPHWRTIYFFGAGFSFLAACIRASLPESRQFLLAREEAKARGLTAKETTKNFIQELGTMFRTNCQYLLYVWIAHSAVYIASHGSQDLYPTYLKTTKKLSPKLASKATIISNCGAIVGGTIAGYSSQYVGRRFAILICAFWTAAFLPLWILPKSFGGLAAGGFFVQAGVQGAWGVVPIYLGEVSPPAFRALFAGLSYQLGNMASSGAAQIEATAGNSLKLAGTNIPDYAAITGILLGAVIAWGIICVICGPEADGALFEQAKVAYQRGGGEADPTELFNHDKPDHSHIEKTMAIEHNENELK
uniref:MFS transporter, SHS family, lactate transporter n=1 Tax=Kwoniella pini CBS 10737 TaxID=1296096 RepID=A0A1B9HV86_9TREE|nr:MFS transporter, SHS family, lactate transporter [Kwoniella pini CBS 10737]OCF47176.1 MFS transporter, SHS family, lactate transporter [Kwoniella pini CBS 10737]